MDKRVSRLLRKSQPKQLTDEWFAMRKDCITASTAACLLVRDSLTCDKYIQLYNLQDTFKKDGKCCNPYSSKFDYFRNKVIGSKFVGNEATYFGQRYERIVTDIYSVNNKTPVLEFGLIKHDTIDYLAASPDGITPDGIMLEIKCPYRRAITGVPPLYYYIQVQIQLEVADLDFCDFVEYSFIEFGTEQEWLDEETLEIPVYNRGLYIQIEKYDDNNEIMGPEHNEYVYPEKQYIDDIDYLVGWSRHLMAGAETEKARISVIYYKVNDLSVVRIERDRVWFENANKVLEKEWNKVLYYRQGSNYKKLIEHQSVKSDAEPVVLDINYVNKYSTGPPPGFTNQQYILDSEDDEEY